MTLYTKHNPESIQALFNSIAENYDRTNSILSFCMHNYWNRSLIDQIPKNSKGPLLDLCAGTGAIAFSYLKKAKETKKVYLLDFSQEMLAFAKEKEKRSSLEKHEIHYLQADAEMIPLPNASVGCVTLAYGIRNIRHPEKCLKDVFRTLQPGGNLGILELTSPKNSVLKLGHRVYLNAFIPIAGRLLTKNKEAYSYLKSSIKQFIQPEELANLLKNVGFVDVHITPLSAGIATLVTGKKP